MIYRFEEFKIYENNTYNNDELCFLGCRIAYTMDTVAP